MFDPRFQVNVLAATPNPQKVAYAEAHQCYSEEYVFDEFFGSECSEGSNAYDVEIIPEDSTWIDPFKEDSYLTETQAGERLIKNCLKHQHFGVIEGPQINFAVGYFPHSVMAQARTHRVAVSFGCQSNRYTSKRILDVVTGLRDVEDVIYLRPVGDYTDRKGANYYYSEEARKEDLEYCVEACKLYAKRIEQGFSEEHARGKIPYDIRQHFVCSFNIRSLFHFLDMRTPMDAQLEIRALCDLMWPHVQEWIPELADYYYQKRWSKNRLAP